MKSISSAFRSVVFAAAALFALNASAGWNLSIVKTSFTLSDDAGNWILTGTVANGTQLTINKTTRGTGALDLTDFVGPNGETIVGFGPGQNNVGSPFVTNALTSVKVPATVKTLATRAFEWCYDLTSVDMPGLETMGTLAFNACTSLTAVSFPAVTSIGYQSFNGCTALEEASFPAIVRIEGKRYNGTFYHLTALKRLTFGADLEYIGPDAFNGCTGIESISPSSLPKLTTLDAAAFEGAFAATGIAFPSTPALETLGDNALYNCKIIGEMTFPLLLSMAQNNFSSCPLLTKVTAPNLTTIGKNCFQSSNGLLALEFSHGLTSIGDNFLRNVTSLLFFEPLFPKRLTTTLSAAKVYNSCKLANSEVVYDFPAIPSVPESLCANPTNLSHVVFKSDVTTIGKNAFKALCPNAVVDFYGTNVPVLAQTALYYNGESDNQRVVVRVFNPEALANWQAAVAPNASVFATYLDKPDYPGDATIGLWSLASGVYAWVVYDEGGGEDDEGGLVIRGVPEELGTVIPSYGPRTGIAVGDTVACSAPVSYNDGDVRATLSGYVVSNVTDDVASFVASGSGNSYLYTQGTGRGELAWIWSDLQYHFTAEVSGFGSVNISDAWVDRGASVTLTATPDPYNVFVGWSGDIGTADPQSATITLTADQARSVTASFRVDEDVEMHWVYDNSDAQNPFLAYVTEDGQGMTWKFAVSGGANALTLVTRLSGAGELNLPEYVTEIGVNVFKSNTELTAVSGHGVLKIGKNAFNSCPALTTIDFPNLETVDPGAFRYDNGLVGDMVFSNLVNIINDNSGNNFENAQFTSFYAPALTNIATAAFRGCSSMTNFVMSENCKRIGDTAFYGCAKLTTIEPFLPKDMDAIGTIPFTQFKTLTCPLVWDQANIREIGPNLFAYHQYEEINVLSPVTNLAAGAFGSLKAGTHINFYCDAPAMADKAIYQYLYNNRYAPERDQRIRIYVRKAGSLPSWKAAVAPYADVFESELKGRTPDYPGRRTMGVILVATDATYPAYAWVIDDATRGLMFLLH